ncbi:hypothetical protein [Paractinoplanes rhizophilus]
MVGTLWPGEFDERTAYRVQSEPYMQDNDQQLLDLASVIDVPGAFSAAERRRAEQLTADKRILVALRAFDAGFTQVLAAGPQLLRRWENADPTDSKQYCGKAVITAALDARRVGVNTPVSAALLAAAAPAYLSSAQRATAPEDWFERAISYSTTLMHGATACLTPVAGGMGQVAGWVTADYLYQCALQMRRTAPIPDQAWQALLDHHDPRESRFLGESAVRWNRPEKAIKFYEKAATAGDGWAACELADLLDADDRAGEAITVLQMFVEGQPGPKVTLSPTRQSVRSELVSKLAGLLIGEDRIDDMRRLADAHGKSAATWFVDMLLDHGMTAELRQRADAGDWEASRWLTTSLQAHGRVDELEERADAGESLAQVRLAELLARQGQLDRLRRRADAGDRASQHHLAFLLAKKGRVGELRRRAKAGNQSAANRLVELLSTHARTDEALAWLRPNLVDWHAAKEVIEVLVQDQRTTDALAALRLYADSGEMWAAVRLNELLVDLCRVDELRLRAKAGDWDANKRLLDLLVAQNREDELRQRADDGDAKAADRLVDLLIDQDRVEVAITVLQTQADAGVWEAAYRLVDLLVELDRVDEAIAWLQPRADSGAWEAAHERDRQTRLKFFVTQDPGVRSSFCTTAHKRLADLLAEHGRIDELRRRADSGDTVAAYVLVDLLAETGQADELSQMADAGNLEAADKLSELLLTRGQVDEAIAVLRSLIENGSPFATSRLINVLADHRRLDELEQEVNAGTSGAAERWMELRGFVPRRRRPDPRDRVYETGGYRETP